QEEVHRRRDRLRRSQEAAAQPDPRDLPRRARAPRRAGERSRRGARGPAARPREGDAGDHAIDGRLPKGVRAGVVSREEYTPSMLTLTSPQFIHQGEIPSQYTCEGANVSPA